MLPAAACFLFVLLLTALSFVMYLRPRCFSIAADGGGQRNGAVVVVVLVVVSWCVVSSHHRHQISARFLSGALSCLDGAEGKAKQGTVLYRPDLGTAVDGWIMRQQHVRGREREGEEKNRKNE